MLLASHPDRETQNEATRGSLRALNWLLSAFQRAEYIFIEMRARVALEGVRAARGSRGAPGGGAPRAPRGARARTLLQKSARHANPPKQI